MSPPARATLADDLEAWPGNVVRVSSDPAENGTVAGRTAGPRAMACAISAAQVLSIRQRQLKPETAARLGYTPEDGCVF